MTHLKTIAPVFFLTIRAAVKIFSYQQCTDASIFTSTVNIFYYRLIFHLPIHLSRLLIKQNVPNTAIAVQCIKYRKLELGDNCSIKQKTPPCVYASVQTQALERQQTIGVLRSRARKKEHSKKKTGLYTSLFDDGVGQVHRGEQQQQQVADPHGVGCSSSLTLLLFFIPLALSHAD